MDDTQYTRLWQEAQDLLAQELPGPLVQDLQLHVTAANGALGLVLCSRSWLLLDLLAGQYLPTISRCLARLAGHPVPIEFRPLSGAKQEELFPGLKTVRGRTQRHAAGAMAPLALNPRYTFDRFVVGAGNQFAHAACRAVVGQPGDRYNPLFLYGAVGLGKTHLVNAVGLDILAAKPTSRVLYLSAQSFMEEVIGAIRRGEMGEFKDRFRSVDILLVDDVQFIGGRDRTQEEFFHIFNFLYDSRRQIILTADKLPREIPGLEERLRNRFEWGLVADIQPPDLETRVAILLKKAELEEILLPQDVALFIANRITSNVRELEGALTTLAAFASLHHLPLSLELATQLLATPPESKAIPLTIERIERAVSAYFHLRPPQLRSKRRARSVAVPRQIAMYLCRRYTRASFPVIGDHFGGRDHSTVIHATQAVEERIQRDPAFRDTIVRIERLLHGS